MSDDNQMHALATDVERLTEENVALRKRNQILEREIVIERARHEASSAEIIRASALRADMSRCLCLLEALTAKLINEEDDL